MKCPYCSTEYNSNMCPGCGHQGVHFARASTFWCEGKQLISLSVPGTSFGHRAQMSVSIILSITDAEKLATSLAETIEKAKGT